MNKLREFIQSKLEEIQDLEVTPEIPDDVLEKNKTYFSYSLQKSYVNSDIDKNFTYNVNLIGFIKRINDDEEDTLKIVDNTSYEIEKKLKELNIRTSFLDVTVIDGIRKIQVTGETLYNEINNTLV
nr:MAG TPA: hypothetical protein [Bacteriophage sp.]